jgi:hypothetical protein
MSVKVVTSTLVALLVSAATAAAQPGPATPRSIEEFVAAQGTYCIEVVEGECFDIFSDVPDLVYLVDDRYSAYVDYVGSTEAFLAAHGGPSLGTRLTGRITERPLADGRATVHAVLKIENTLAWVADLAEPWTVKDAPMYFGSRASDVLAGAPPALCDAHFELKFINTAPGAPLPDLIQLLFFAEPGQRLLFVSIRCNAQGLLHETFGVEEGTPGRANILEHDMLIPPHGEDGVLKIPVTLIELRTAGR